MAHRKKKSTPNAAQIQCPLDVYFAAIWPRKRENVVQYANQITAQCKWGEKTTTTIIVDNEKQRNNVWLFGS